MNPLPASEFAIYLSGPISGCSLEEMTAWRHTVRAAWPGRVIDPAKRDFRSVREWSQAAAKALVTADIAEIGLADGVLVYYTKPTVGTMMEMVYARNMGKPVVVWNASPYPSDGLSPWIIYHADRIERTSARSLYALATLLIHRKRRAMLPTGAGSPP